MRKTNYFEINKSVSTRVVEFATLRILKKEIQLEYGRKIDKVREQIKYLNEMQEDNSQIMTKEQITGKLAEKYAEIEELELARNEQIKNEATFELTDNDKALKKALKGTSYDDINGIFDALKEWFSNYNYDLSDKETLCQQLLSAIGAKEDFKKLCASNGSAILVVNNTKALDMLYWVLFEGMVQAGTIKNAQLPEIIVDKYGKKKNSDK